MIELPGLTIEYLEADTDAQDLCLRYWKVDETGRFVESVASIYKEAGLTQVEFTRVVRRHCRAWSTVLKCSRCAQALQFVTRSDFSGRSEGRGYVCRQCVEAEQAERDTAKRLVIMAEYERVMAAGVSVEALSIRHCLFLLALSKFAADEDLGSIGAYSRAGPGLLTPMPTFDLALIDELWVAGMIAISPDSSLDAIVLGEKGDASFHFEQVRWTPTVRCDEPFNSVYEHLEARIRRSTFAEGHVEQLKACCDELASLECLAFLEAVLGEYGMGYSPGEKTRAVLAKALEEYSVAQVCNFLWRAAKDAAAYQMRSGVSRSHAARTVVGSIERQIERAQANGWEVNGFRRNFKLPQSVLSRVVYNLLLGTDDGGFTEHNETLLARFQVPG